MCVRQKHIDSECKTLVEIIEILRQSPALFAPDPASRIRLVTLKQPLKELRRDKQVAETLHLPISPVETITICTRAASGSFTQT